MQGKTTRPMSLELRKRRVLAYELREVDWSQITKSFMDHMWWPDLLLRDPALLTAPATTSLDPPLFAWKLCSLSMTETVGILVESILVGCGAPLMENCCSRTLHQPGQSFLRTVLKSETNQFSFFLTLLLQGSGFPCLVLLSLLYPSQTFTSPNLWCVFSFLGVCFPEDWNEHAIVKDALCRYYTILMCLMSDVF